MPQLDKVTFFSQYFWLCVFFFGFYIFQLKFFLPEMSRILKFRKKRFSESSTITLQGENDKVRNSTETTLENLFKNLRNVFKDSSSTNDKWFSEHRAKFSQDFKKGNLKYLQSIAKKSLSNNLAIQSVNGSFSSKIFLTLLTLRFLSQRSVQKRNFTTLLVTPSSSSSKSFSEASLGKDKTKGKDKSSKKTASQKPLSAFGEKGIASSSLESADDSAAKKGGKPKKGVETKKKKKN